MDTVLSDGMYEEDSEAAQTNLWQSQQIFQVLLLLSNSAQLSLSVAELLLVLLELLPQPVVLPAQPPYLRAELVSLGLQLGEALKDQHQQLQQEKTATFR